MQRRGETNATRGVFATADAASSRNVEENHVTYGREPARWKLPKVRDYCFSRRRDARGRSVSKSVFAPSLLVPLLREKREASEARDGKTGDRRRETERERERETVEPRARVRAIVEEEDEEDDDDDDEED